MLKFLVICMFAIFLFGFSLAQPPLDIVHTEKVRVGPYQATVGFTRWPVQAERSLDMTFTIDGGIEGKKGTLTLITNPPQLFDRTKQTGEPYPLERHPRMREAWGLDVFAFPSPGQWQLEFAIDGPQGIGEGSLAVVMLEPPVFLPKPLAWSLAFLPLFALLIVIGIVWQRDKPNRHAATWSW
jgi:hypothetical protein